MMHKNADETAPSLVVSTDLDGTLLDHDTYEWQAAQPSLERLARLDVPVIFNSSKTFDELLALQEAIGINGPFVVENGAAIYLPTPGYDLLVEDGSAPPLAGNTCFREIGFGLPRGEILEHIHGLRATRGWRFEGFDDWSVAKIMAQTGLDEKAAVRASAKRFSEPLIWRDSDENLQRFRAILEQQGCALVRGGRFHHVQGGTDKGRPLQWLLHRYELVTGTRPALVCLGDSENDSAMLNVADIAVRVRSPVAAAPAVLPGRTVIDTRALGPAGWHEAIGTILDKMDRQ